MFNYVPDVAVNRSIMFYHDKLYIRILVTVRHLRRVLVKCTNTHTHTQCKSNYDLYIRIILSITVRKYVSLTNDDLVRIERNEFACQANMEDGGLTYLKTF